jgi:hypothetical protein
MPRPKPGQSHLADVGNRVGPDELLVPDPGPGVNRRLDAAKPSVQELLDRGALVTEDLAVAVDALKRNLANQREERLLLGL